MDYEGKYGIGPNTFYIPFSTISEGRCLERFLKSDEYKVLALATKTTRQYLKIGFIQHLNLGKIMGKIMEKIMKTNYKTAKRKSNKANSHKFKKTRKIR